MLRTVLSNTLCLLFVAATAAPVMAEPIQSDGKVSHVTLYRGQAMVTRTLEIDGAKGPQEIIVTNLPSQVINDSLFAEAAEGVEVRAVRFRARAVGEEPRGDVRDIEKSIEAAQLEIAANENSTQLLAQRTAYLDNLQNFIIPTAKQDMAKGVLNADSLEKLTTFAFKQREEIAAKKLELGVEAHELKKKLENLQQQMSLMTNGTSTYVREAVLFVQKEVEGKHAIRLNYLVGDCGWSPTYTMRAGADRKTVKVEYNALIHQLTGEDWNDVTLTLSTASPSLSAAGPGLAPFRVALTAEENKPNLAKAQLQKQVREIYEQQKYAERTNRNSLSLSDNYESSWELNNTATGLQCLELAVDGTSLTELRFAGEGGEEPSLSYGLSGAVSLATRNDQQMVRIMQTDLPASFYHVATPVLTSYVYREADLLNNSQEDMLAGPMTVYLDGRFVGRSEIPTVARGQNFVVGFGADAQLRARRELADKNESVQGGNRELEFEYRLVIENYKDEPANVRVLDRIPSSENASDVRVAISDMGTDLSDDVIYLRSERPKGILRWDIEAPAGATGEQAQLISYNFSVEYDRTFQLAAPTTVTQQLQEEFEQLQEMRLKR